ncbi:MAG TPA: imidazole glycerol phosphate synthase subunit HisH [Rhodospirillaceae bacterium]|nr:imidazole glycerol phosphate synthase subunit HisH [Rhodospirillaceae bacterium]
MAKESIVIIDYGSGNLRSAAKAFERVAREEGLDREITVSNRPEDVRRAGRVVLPGQGAFGDCMQSLCAIPGMREALEETVIKAARPYLGICVGMQLMADKGLEHGEHKGLGWIPGEVVPMKPADKALKIPHMGWNELHAPVSGDPAKTHFVLRNIDSLNNYYFVHSYMFKCKEERHILAHTDYGGPVTAIVGRDNMIGVQFHPEKSQSAGLKLIANFLQWKP